MYLNFSILAWSIFKQILSCYTALFACRITKDNITKDMYIQIHVELLTIANVQCDWSLYVHVSGWSVDVFGISVAVSSTDCEGSLSLTASPLMFRRHWA